MTTDQTDSLLDLLYGELSEEDEKLMREELADSAELRAELDGYEGFLGQVREAMPVEEVPSSVHASIMDAARSAVENPEERGGRRTVAEPERQGIWRRLSGGQGSQIALVAAVLIAGVFVVKFMSPANAPMAGDVGSVQEAPPAPMAAKTEEAPADEAVAVAEEEGMPEPEIAEQPIEGTEQLAAADESDNDYEFANRRDRRGAAEQKSANVEKSLLDELGRSQNQAPAEPVAKPSPDPKPKPTTRRRARSTSTKTTSKKKAESSLEALGGEDKSSSGIDGMLDLDGSAAEANARGDAAPAPSAAAKEDDAKAYRPPDNSLAAVTQRWQNSDYNGTIREADEFLATGEGSQTDRARALQLKAQSLARLGQYRAADRIYEQIEKNYPGYQSAAISQARSEAQQKLRKRPKRKKKVAPQESYEAEPTFDSLD